MSSGSDFKAHEQTYSGVMGMLKWGTIGVAILTIIVVAVIANS